MKHKKPTVIIGIPAYNEEQNIKFLLKDLLRQRRLNFKIKKIIICSDGSTDNTEKEVKKIRNSRIKLIINKKRKGQAYSQNELISYCHSDILVLLNADISIKNNDFIEKLVEPILLRGVDLTSAMVEELTPINFLEKILSKSMEIKKQIYENYQFGNNIYTCHGRSRAFSKRLYQSISLKDHIVAEDAYSYLYCLSHNYKYEYCKNAKVYYKLPNNFKDHKRQSLRFLNSKEQLMKEFGKDFVKSQYYLPQHIIIKYFCLHLLKNPIPVVLYIILFGWLKINSFFSNETAVKWEIASSSKILQKESSYEFK